MLVCKVRKCEFIIFIFDMIEQHNGPHCVCNQPGSCAASFPPDVRGRYGLIAALWPSGEGCSHISCLCGQLMEGGMESLANGLLPVNGAHHNGALSAISVVNNGLAFREGSSASL